MHVQVSSNECFLVKGDADNAITIQSFLPDLTNFVLVGNSTIRGFDVRCLYRFSQWVFSLSRKVHSVSRPCSVDVLDALPCVRSNRTLLGCHPLLLIRQRFTLDDTRGCHWIPRIFA
jgi:hypothetical protein